MGGLQFVGMSGKSADWLGMAIASYEWMAAITLVVVAFVFLPTFLRSGIFTIPEFLEYRYTPLARAITLLNPLPQPVVLPVNAQMDMTTNRSTKLFGIGVIVLTLILYARFW
jgi:hypothetical protein